MLAHHCVASAAVAAVAAGRTYSEERLVQFPVDALDKLGGGVTVWGGALCGGLLERESGAREEAVCFQRDVHGRNVGGCARVLLLRQYLYLCTSKASNLRTRYSAGARGFCRTQPFASVFVLMY